ncbi:MAG: AAA family ATPase [Actinobacteria bacterium]|nr:AAA family ATPase [Actinomycetota bacterium]
MSGVGKSAALAELAQRGFQVVETDREPWSEWSETAGGYVWREDLISELLSREDGSVSYVAGTVSNQGRFYSQFDAVVLLSAPLEILLRRIETRTSNDYGKSADERALIVGQVAEVEPLLRATCTHELDATQPIGDIVDQLVAIGPARRSLASEQRCAAGERESQGRSDRPLRRRARGAAGQVGP